MATAFMPLPVGPPLPPLGLPVGQGSGTGGCGCTAAGGSHGVWTPPGRTPALQGPQAVARKPAPGGCGCGCGGGGSTATTGPTPLGIKNAGQNGNISLSQPPIYSSNGGGAILDRAAAVVGRVARFAPSGVARPGQNNPIPNDGQVNLVNGTLALQVQIPTAGTLDPPFILSLSPFPK
jgi:hypothetical protein